MKALINVVKWAFGVLFLSAPFSSSTTLTEDSNSTCTITGSICASLTGTALQTYPNYANLTTAQLIQRLGYPVETHTVTTEDNYILTLFRIPYSDSSPPSTGKIPVLLVHGVLSSSAQWVWQPPTRALIFMLVDAGYDVWIGNSRGTTYSRGHVNYSSDTDLPYWNFSFHEMGKYDLPATVDYILSQSGESSLYYVGHSLGTTQFYAGVSLSPNLGTKIRTMFSLSASGYINHMTNPLFRALSALLVTYSQEQVANVLAQGQMSPEFLQQYITNFTTYCTQYTVNCALCGNVYGVLFGIDPCQIDFSQLPGVLAHLPDTTSVKTFSHILQDATWGTFSQYDYGTLQNLKEYGTPKPPAYNWSNINVPTVIYYGLNDNLAVPQDVQRTAVALGSNVKELNRIAYVTWDHMDSVMGKDADIFIYQSMLDIMNNRKYG